MSSGLSKSMRWTKSLSPGHHYDAEYQSQFHPNHDKDDPMLPPGSPVPRILLIDDRPEELREVLEALKVAGYSVALADSPMSGFRRAQAMNPALIILDLRMPQVDGFAVCRLLREAQQSAKIPIIFLSSVQTVEERLEALRIGGVDFVTKPCHPEEVVARVGVHLRLAHRPSNTPDLEATGEPRDADEVILRAAIRLIQDNLKTPLELSELANSVGTNKKRLLRIFRQRMGTTVYAFIREERMRRARSLLEEGILSVEDIAAFVGYQSAANFSTAFRSIEGMSPREYRRARKEGGEYQSR
ncbi:response regulator [Guyparkeria sp.]|uniref:response regulator n=1 Tax=Guyparkeria sp. TaxID=2035736 RepID=UPI003970B6D1